MEVSSGKSLFFVSGLQNSFFLPLEHPNCCFTSSKNLSFTKYNIYFSSDIIDTLRRFEYNTLLDTEYESSIEFLIFDSIQQFISPDNGDINFNEKQLKYIIESKYLKKSHMLMINESVINDIGKKSFYICWTSSENIIILMTPCCV